MRTLILLISLANMALFAHAQPLSCADLRSGEFYYYPKNTLVQYHIYVTGNVEKVVSMTKRKGAAFYDSSLYKIEWKDDCTYILKYMEGSGMTDEELKFVTKHKIAYRVDTIAADYYVFDSYQDKLSGGFMGKDTLWKRPQSHFEDNMLFVATDPNIIKKHHFSDTSKVALLYVYRTGKLKLSFSDLFLSYQDIPMGVLKNKSALVFALYKEGTFNLHSWINGNKEVGNFPLEVTFGKKYYIRAELIWGFYMTGNTKLQFTPMDPKEGKNEFEAIWQQ